MGVEESKLLLDGGASDEFAEIFQTPDSVGESQLAGLINLLGWVLFGHGQEALQDAQAFGPALAVERLSPGTR